MIDCSPLDALALVRALGSKLGLAVALPEDRFAFLLRCTGSGLGSLELPFTVVEVKQVGGSDQHGCR